MKVMENNYVDLLGEDYSEYMTSPEQIELFNKLIELQKTLHRPVPECVIELVASLNLSAQIKGKPKRAFIQANPQLN